MAVYNKERQIKEIVRCGKDPIYFINKYCKIEHIDRGLIPFETYDFQDDVIHDLLKHRLNVILKARQLGLSTTVAAYALWLALFHKHKNILVIATKRATAMNFLKKVKVILRHLPKWLMLAQVVTNAKHEIEFSHGSTVKAIPTSDDAGRSEALSLLIIDEAAFIRNFDELWTGLQPTISTGGRCVVLSTPNGVGGQFYQLYTDAEQGINNFNANCLPWEIHPEHDQDWFDQETKGMGRRKIAQEYLCDFVSSGETFLSMEDIEWVRLSQKDPIDKWHMDRSLWVWSYPKVGHRYLISADVSRGDAFDFSAFHVIDMDEGEVAAEYKGRIPPDDLGVLLAETGTKYNNALVCPERNTFGYQTLCKLRDVGYPKVFKEGSKAVYVVDYSPITDDVSRMGFDTQGRSRIRIISKMEEVIRNKALRLYSSRLYDELKTFVWTGTRAQAMKGRNDDLVISLAIGLWLHDVSDGYNNRDLVLQENMLAAMGVSGHTWDEVPGSGRNLNSDWNPYMPFMSKAIPIKVDESEALGRDPRFNHGDFAWVLDPQPKQLAKK